MIARSSRDLVLGCTFALALCLGAFGCAKVGEVADASGVGGSAGGSAGSFAGSGGGLGGDDGGSAGVFGGFDGPPAAVCGNGTIEFGENCEDGNTVSGDGCSSKCVAEKGFQCPEPPQTGKCTLIVVCGNGMIEGTEACDDGNKLAGDGCAADCKSIECGWECPAGMNCRAAKCGDGKLAGIEQCDDGNATNGDGCSANCTLESKPINVPEGWDCKTPAADAMGCKGPTKCTTTVCGNKIKEGSEQCDLGDAMTGDGCSPFCRLEPKCPVGGGPCTTACGDGLILATDTDQECDDGNTVSGDGCSADCKREKGFDCTNVMVKPDRLVLPIVYHDFKGWNEGDALHDHPDFFHFPGNGTGYPGIVQTTLGPAGVPVHVAGCFPMPGAGYPALLTANNCAPGGKPAPTGPTWDPTVDWFGMWYVDNATYNKTIVSTLTLPPLAGTNAFQFSSDVTPTPGNPPGFFPLDGMGWATGQTGRNYGFTSVVRTWFEYTGTANLTFFGDDDVWVFINKKLAVDLGGTHQKSSGSVTLDATNGHGYVCDFVAPGTDYPSKPCTATATSVGNGHDVDLGLKVGSVYEIAVFQAERYPSESNYQLTLGGFSGVKSMCVGSCGNGEVTAPEQCDKGFANNNGEYGGCNANCTLAPFCGDKIVQKPQEDCDGEVGCGANCKIVPIQ